MNRVREPPTSLVMGCWLSLKVPVICPCLLPRSFPVMHDVSGGNLLLSFIRGFFEGVFLLSLLLAAQESECGKKSVAPALLGCFWADLNQLLY